VVPRLVKLPVKVPYALPDTLALSKYPNIGFGLEILFTIKNFEIL
jgi:hypothetical protein